MLKLKGTIIFDIWWKILFFILYTGGLLCLHNFVPGCNIDFPMTLIPVLGVVTGLLLVFRTNTAYDRFYEGRQIWSRISFNIRVITKSIWVSVMETNADDLVEKLSLINLLVGFAYSTKNHLREIYSYEEKKVSRLLPHLGKISLQNCHGNCDKISPKNIPIELTFYIHSYLKNAKETGKADGVTISEINTAINNVVECLCSLERILGTPIPSAYSVHLNHAIWIFLLSLPFQLIGRLNWFTIPAVGFVTVAVLWILEIGKEIENPFGYDDDDLPLDDFCDTMYMESWRFTGCKMPSTEEWLNSRGNRPLQPSTSLPANVLGNMGEDYVRKVLSKRGNMRIGEGTKNQGEVEDFRFLSVPTIIPISDGTEKHEVKQVLITSV